MQELGKHPVQLWFSQSEKQALEQKAGLAGLKLATWIRVVVLGYARGIISFKE